MLCVSSFFFEKLIIQFHSNKIGIYYRESCCKKACNPAEYKRFYFWLVEVLWKLEQFYSTILLLDTYWHGGTLFSNTIFKSIFLCWMLMVVVPEPGLRVAVGWKGKLNKGFLHFFGIIYCSLIFIVHKPWILISIT